jgi:hypothetical protein
MEDLGLLLREELGFLFVADCEEMVCSWGGACSGDCLGEVVNDFVMYLIIDICAMLDGEK